MAQALETSPPDFTIYEKKKKSFDADMKTDSFDVHVKTQDKASGEKYGISWVFQYSGGGYGHTDPLLAKPTVRDLAVFVTVDMTALSCTIHAATRCVLLPKFLSLPKLIQLYGSKRVVYLDSLKPEFIVDLSLLTKGNMIEK